MYFNPDSSICNADLLTPIMIVYNALKFSLLTKMFQVLVDEVIFFSMLKTSTTNKVKFRKSVTAVESRKKRFAPVVLAITLIKCSNAAKPVARLT